jgi:phosphate-selective porin
MRILTLSAIIMVAALVRPVGAQESTMAVPGILYGSPESFAEFHGFVNLEYLDFETAGDRGGTSTFDQHNFYFNAIAKVRQNVTVFGEVEYEHGGEEVLLDRAFIDWMLHGEHLNLRLGKFYSPFGLEIREYQAPVRKLVSRPQVRDLLFNEWTEVGANLYGRIGSPMVSVDYDVAVVNGPGDADNDGDGVADLIADSEEARQNRDNNSNRTVIGRVALNLPAGIVVGGSYAGGNYASDGTPDLDFTLAGADAALRMMGIDVRVEWVQRTVDLTTTTELESDSLYAQASYKMDFNQPGLNYIEPVVRFDTMDPDTDTDDDETDRLSVGVNYSPYPHFKLSAEYQTRDEEPETDNDGFLMAIVVDF